MAAFFSQWKNQAAARRVPRCCAVVVAAGHASRMQGVDKIMTDLMGKPVLVYALEAFEACPEVQDIVVVTREDLLVPIGALCREWGVSKVRKVVLGGESRTASVLAGLREMPKGTEFAAIHDGARPFLSQEVLCRTLEAARVGGAAAPAIPVKDTVKLADRGVVVRTVERSSLFAVQTPQIFDADLIRGALEKAEADSAVLTDDCSAVERLGKKVALVEGDEQNLKITTPVDLCFGEAILQCR